MQMVVLPHNAGNEASTFQKEMLECIYLKALHGLITLEQYLQHFRHT